MLVKIKLLTAVALLICVYMAGPVFGQGRCLPAKHARLPNITGSTYHRARARLLAAGWQPFQTKSFNQDDPDIAYGNGRLFWKKGYKEVEFCSGTGVGACAFLFTDVYGNKLRVTTAGEELPKERTYARINSFRFVCESTN